MNPPEYRRVTSKFFSVSSIEAVNTNTFTGHSCPALTAQFIRPRALGMVFAHPANAETGPAVRVDHETSLTGWCRYASIAQFERMSLRRSPDLSIPMISSSKKFADQFGSLSSPDFSSTLQAIAKDCSIRSVSVIAEKTEAQPIRSSTSSARRIRSGWSATRSAKEKAWGPRSKDREHTPRLQSRRQFLADSRG